MINDFYPNEEDDYCNTCRTTGCSCCSCEYNIEHDKDKILESSKDNIRVAKKICEYYKISFSKFCKGILTEKECKKHKPYKKYPDNISKDNYCSICDKNLGEFK